MFSPKIIKWANRIPSPQKETYLLRLFGLTKVPMIGFLWPKIIKIEDYISIIRIPSSYRSKNHVNSMYFGALCAGADMAAGSLAVRHMMNERRGGKTNDSDETNNSNGTNDNDETRDKIPNGEKNLSLLFTSIEADFFKLAKGDIDFVCYDGIEILEGVRWAYQYDKRYDGKSIIRLFN